MPTASLNGFGLYFEDTDPKNEAGLPVVVFLHGAAGNAMSWWQQIPAFSQAHRCVTYDCRGFYRSPDTTGEGIAGFIADLEALVDHLGAVRVSLVAQSMGGRAAIAFAVRHPERTAALVMANTWGAFSWPENWQLSSDLGAQSLGHIQAGMIRGLSRGFQDNNKELTFLFCQISGANRAPKPELAGAQPGGPSLAEVRQLKVPLLCITSEEDIVIPAPLVQNLAKEVPGAECVTLSSVGHSIYYEAPSRFNELVLGFLAKHIGGGSVQR